MRLLVRIFVLTVLLLALPPKVFAGGSEVGNGGEGVLRGGRLILRDLAEGEIYKNPFVGTEIDPAMMARVAGFSELEELKLDSTLLARKLTDLERIAPGVGFILFSTIQKYRFVFVEELGSLEDDEGDKSEKRIQIAIRQYADIRISRNAFSKLNQINRVALVLHEGFYALGRQYCKPKTCRQKSAFARELTNSLFRETRSSASQRKRFLKLMDLEELENDCETTKLRVTYEFSAGHRQTEFFSSTENFYSQARRICWSLESDAALTVNAQKVGLIQEVYLSPLWAQYAYRAKRAERELSRASNSRENCEADLQKIAFGLYDDPDVQAWQRFCSHSS